MNKNKYEPNLRNENTIDKYRANIPDEFNIDEIKGRFDNDINSIREFETKLGFRKEKKNEDFILFSKIVFIEAIFDFYLHEVSKYGVTRILRNEWDASENHIKLNVSLKKLLEYMEKTNFEEMIRAILNNEWSKAVFMDFENFTEQINLIGLDKNEIMKKAFPNEKDPCKYGRTFLEELYKKRNHIVHQLMRKHIDATRETLSETYVEKSIDGVNNIANAIYNIVKHKNN